MIESALVLIHASADGNDHIGCGAVIEGGYIVTCRHVWDEATALAAVPVAVFLHCRDEDGAPLRHNLDLVSDCRLGPPPHPDIVLLKPLLCPAKAFRLQPAASEGYQTGPAEAQAMVHRPKDDGSDPWEEVTVDGTLRDRMRSDGRRQFSGARDQGYWFVRGSSGSPLFKPGAHQLAGILSLAELGANDRKSTLHEAFVVPGTVVRQHLKQLVDAVAAEQHEELLMAFARLTGVDPEKLRPTFDGLANRGLAPAKILADAEKSVAAQFDFALTEHPRANAGTEIDAALSAARESLGQQDSAGALAVLSAKMAEEQATHRQRLLPLLRETADIQRANYNHAAARATLDQILAFNADSVWDWIAVGAIYRDTGALSEARAAFEHALAAALRQDAEGRDVAAVHDRLGDVLEAQGEGATALEAYRQAMAIRERLAQADPANTQLHRDLSISHERIGDVLVVQGDGAAALAAYWQAMAIRERLARADPATADGQRDLSVSHNKIGDVLVAQGEGASALAAYRQAMAIRERLTQAEPTNAQWQRDLSVSQNKLGDVLVAQGEGAAALAAYRQAMAIRERLGQADPANAEWQRDLSVSYNKIGDVLVAQGEGASALAAYRQAIAIAERLGQADPANAEWQRDLSVSYNKIGDVLVAQGEGAAALGAYRQSMAIAERLAQTDPVNAQWQRDLIVSAVKLAETDPPAAASHLSRALAVARSLADSGRLAPVDAWMVAELERRLRDLGGPSA